MTATAFPGGFEVGHQVTYLADRLRGRPRRICRRGVVAGAAVRDEKARTTWIPVRADHQTRDVEPEWVCADDVVDVVPLPRTGSPE